MNVLPSPLLALDLESAAVLLDDAVGDAEPQPGSLADLLGGEERLENADPDALP